MSHKEIRSVLFKKIKSTFLVQIKAKLTKLNIKNEWTKIKRLIKLQHHNVEQQWLNSALSNMLWLKYCLKTMPWKTLTIKIK